MAPSETNIALMSGALAGLSVDLTLFPLDTVKTRLQSSAGFRQSGGFRGIYSGVQTAAIGSAPAAAMFFVTYETCKSYQLSRTATRYQPIVHMTAASMGEIMACLVRVPCEVVKQRTQATPNISQIHVLKTALTQEGVLGLYRGYFSTVMREIPFSFIQFPLWEFLKSTLSKHQNRPVEPWQSGACGALSGGFSAAITTPLDVAKTRIMLAKSGTTLAKGNILQALAEIHSQRGISGLFAGVTARVSWIALGGAVFLGVYDKVRHTLIDAFR